MDLPSHTSLTFLRFIRPTDLYAPQPDSNCSSRITRPPPTDPGLCPDLHQSSSTNSPLTLPWSPHSVFKSCHKTHLFICAYRNVNNPQCILCLLFIPYMSLLQLFCTAPPGSHRQKRMIYQIYIINIISSIWLPASTFVFNLLFQTNYMYTQSL